VWWDRSESVSVGTIGREIARRAYIRFSGSSVSAHGMTDGAPVRFTRYPKEQQRPRPGSTATTRGQDNKGH
jgi:hypothetical protein